MNEQDEPIITVKQLRRALAESDAETAAPLLVDAGVLHALVREYENAMERANDAVARRYYAEHVIDRLTLDFNLARRSAPTTRRDSSVRSGKSTASCGHELAPYWAEDPRSSTITKSRTREGAKALCYATDCEACRWSWEKAGILFKTQEEADAWMREPWQDGPDGDGETVR